VSCGAACILLAVFDKAGERRAVNKDEPKEKETFVQILLSLLQVFRFPLATWFIYFICVFFYVGASTHPPTTHYTHTRHTLHTHDTTRHTTRTTIIVS
jgi:fucose permease